MTHTKEGALLLGVGGALVDIKTLLSRDPCVHANTAIEMIDAILKEHPAAQPEPVQDEPFTYYRNYDGGTQDWPDEKTIPLYTTPPAAQPSVPLTFARLCEIEAEIARPDGEVSLYSFGRAIEADHGITATPEKGN